MKKFLPIGPRLKDWTADSITIVLDLPSKWLHPNNQRGNSRLAAMARSAKKKQSRKLARDAAAMLLWESGSAPPFWNRVSVLAVFYHKTRRGRDDDGLIASLKSAIDGICDAGVIANDSGVTWAKPQQEIDRVRPRVEIIVSKQ